MLLKSCKCGKLIPQSVKMCEECERRQQSRHMIYNNTRRDKRAAEFYLSKEWRDLRPVIMSVYEYVDIYALYVEHQLITLKDSDPIHHIIELEDDWEQRLNPLNLIPLSHRTHNTITALSGLFMKRVVFTLILAAFIFTVVMIFVFLRMGSEPSTLIENVFRFLSVEGGAMALIKSVKTVKGTKSNGEIQHNDEPEQDDEEVQG